MTARWVDANRNSVPFCFVACPSVWTLLLSNWYHARTRMATEAESHGVDRDVVS